MDLQFVIHEAEHGNVFLGLLNSYVAEPVLLSLIWHMQTEEGMLVSVRDNQLHYKLVKVYEETTGDGERFILFLCDTSQQENALYGLWMNEQELVALFQIHGINGNKWINVAVESWGERWLPWAQRIDGNWRPYVLYDDNLYLGATVLNNVRTIGRCVDEYQSPLSSCR